MHAGHVPVQGVLLHRAIMAKWAAMRFLPRLTHHVDLQLALAGEELLTVWALQPWVWEMEVKVFHQMCPLLKTALALWTHVGLEQVFGTLSHISCSKKNKSPIQCGGMTTGDTYSYNKKCSRNAFPVLPSPETISILYFRENTERDRS